MKRINLSQGKFAVVDDEDYDRLSKHKWSYYKSPDGCEKAVRRAGSRTVYLHREILGFPNSEVDHINLDGLNNTRQNLRLANRSQNAANRRRQSNNSSGYKGVGWKADRRKWRAYITKDNRQIHLGYFDNPREAAVAYNRKALELFGEFSLLNAWPLS